MVHDPKPKLYSLSPKLRSLNDPKPQKRDFGGPRLEAAGGEAALTCAPGIPRVRVANMGY